MSGKLMESALLTDNPFRIVPELHPTIWAGHEDLKQDLERIITQSLITSPSWIIANWGDWGTGKSHSAHYFSFKENIQELMRRQKLEVPEPMCILMAIPKPLRSGEALSDFYQAFIERIGFEAIETIVRTIYKRINDYLTKQGVSRSAVQDEVKLVFSRNFVIEDLTKIFLKIAGIPTSTTAEDRLLIWKYIHREATSTELTRLGVVTTIDSYTAIQRVITGLLNLFVYQDRRYSPTPPHSEVFLWIDECEGIWDLKAADVFNILSIFRDLIDNTPNNLTVFLNASFTGGGSIRDLRALFGDAVMSRARRTINFKHMVSTDEALKYVVQLLNNEVYRPPKLKQKCPDEFYPFSMETLKAIIEKTRPLTPRRVNDNCSIVLEMAIHDGIIKKIGDLIPPESAVKYLPALLSS